MPILNITTNFAGQEGVYPRLVRLETDDFLTRVVTPGYLNSSPIVAGNPVLPTDFIFLTYRTSLNEIGKNIFVPEFSAGGIITLVSFIADDGITPPLQLFGIATDQLLGTIALTNGSPIATGTGTTFLDLIIGQAITILNIPYTVLSIQSNTSLTLATNYEGEGVSDAVGFIDGSFLECFSSANNKIFEIGSAGQIVTPLISRKNVRFIDTSLSQGILATDSGGIVCFTNTGLSSCLLSAALLRVPVGFEFTAVQTGTGSNSFFVSGGDSILVEPFSLMTQGTTARVKLVSIDGGGLGLWSVDLVGIDPTPQPYYTYDNQSFAFSGPWATSLTTRILAIYDKQVVTVSVTRLLQAVAASPNTNPILSVVNLPAQFAPQYNSTQIIKVSTTGAESGATVTAATINTAGQIQIPSLLTGFSNWTDADGGSTGFFDFSISYVGIPF